jgi:hypothetical protein
MVDHKQQPFALSLSKGPLNAVKRLRSAQAKASTSLSPNGGK